MNSLIKCSSNCHEQVNIIQSGEMYYFRYFLLQAIWRSVIRFGLANLCRENNMVMSVIKMIMAIPHLPPNRGPPNSRTIPPYCIQDGLTAIVEYVNHGNLDPRLMDVISYVQRYWIRRLGAERFSVFGLPRRTNNNLEGFHSKLLAIFGPHCTIWLFISK